MDPESNLPDANCVFIPTGNNSNIKSSYMAAPFLSSVDHFSKNSDAQYQNNIHKPTKHNFMCNYKSVWDVIMENEDFVDTEPMNTSNPAPSTKFTIWRFQILIMHNFLKFFRW